jgi:hypothetical protein
LLLLKERKIDILLKKYTPWPVNVL